MSAAPDGSARLTEVEVWTVATNVALAANGGAATASSSLAGYPVSAVNDGERVGATWNTGGLWADNTFGTWPDWVQVNFNGVQTIDSIDVLMLQDGYTTPVEPTPSMTFNTSTGFGLNQFQVQYWDTATAAWVTVPGGSVSANNLVWRRLAFQPVATDRIRVLAEASPDGRARLVEIEAWTALPVNVARAGSVSSSSDQSTYPASAVNNGDRKGDPWNLNGIWADSTPGAWPDWVQITFAGGKKAIHAVDVFTLQDNYTAPAEPTYSTTFSLYGLTAYRVQYRSGTAWLDVPGGSVTGNNLVWRRFAFDPISTDAIRVLAEASPDGSARVTEIEAWETPGTAAGFYVHTDHLDTPRVITDAAQQVVWKWDNADPFGANLPNENPSGLGVFSCNLRLPGQYFDLETGLHYNYYRDYDPGIGRYIQSDPIGLKGGINMYAYVRANPIRYVDPLGLADYTGLGNIVSHLNWLADLQRENFWTSPNFRPERQMLERLRRGEETKWDVSFYHHEANEAAMCIQYRGMPRDDALRNVQRVHEWLEQIQGGTPRDRYHPNVIRANPTQFPSGW